jgi:5-methylcytosine-specific restriction protein B
MAAADLILSQLVEVIRGEIPPAGANVRPLLDGLFGERYQRRHFAPSILRDAYALATGDGDEGVPYAGLIHPDNPPSGPYGGTSVVWFPSRETGSLMGFGVGTRGLAPDEGILTRPGHRRRIAALRSVLSKMGVEAWSKPDPAALGVQVPKATQARFAGFAKTFQRYGHEMYCIAAVPRDPKLARAVVTAFLDLYAFERGWQVLKAAEAEFEALQTSLRQSLFPSVDAADVDGLLRRRRFVVLQGPPGTGKTRLAEQVRKERFGDHGMTIQFHPAVTYEDFVVGLSPDPTQGNLRFDVRPGWLLQAIHAAKERPYLLVIDEVNRADLGKVLGEAIYLFEAGEIGKRKVTLPHKVAGMTSLRLPENLYVLATMNTADRSISGMDLAVRRRFAFVTLMPEESVVDSQGLPDASAVFRRLLDVFIEHAPDEALDLLPGHAYFLADNQAALRERFRYELLPLLDEYLRQGFLGPAGAELYAVRDAVQDFVRGGELR